MREEAQLPTPIIATRTFLLGMRVLLGPIHSGLFFLDISNPAAAKV
jgi:hypothetical protein